MATTPLWRATFEAIIHAPRDDVWAITSDFLGIHKWASSVISSCTLLEGDPRAPGCVRIDRGRDGSLYTRERLLAIEDQSYFYRYVVEDCSLAAFNGYVSTFKLSDGGEGRTRLVWSYEVPRMDSCGEEEFRALTFGFYERCISDLKRYVGGEAANGLSEQ